MSRHGLVSRRSSPEISVATKPEAGQGKTVSRPGPGVTNRPGDRDERSGAHRVAIAQRVPMTWALCAQPIAAARSMCAQRVRAVHAHCALDPVLGLVRYL